MSKLHVSKYGRASNAPVLVLLHGWGSSSKVWQTCVEKLTENFQVWCIDLPGHGESHSVQWDESVAQGLALLTDIMPERCYLVGWSLGGLYAQLCAAQHPQRVQSLMLIASTVKFVASPDWPHAMAEDKFAKFVARFDASPKVIMKQFRALQTLHSVSAKEIMRVLEQTASSQFPLRMAWGLRWLQALDLRNSCIAEKIPIQLLHGENDQVAPLKAANQAMEIWQAKRKNLQFCIINDAGHAPFLSHPERFQQQVNLMLDNKNKPC